ncbi:sensor histidine kinase [Alicyclobacillus tolerans]|uniref:histidine kinase n=1 Tax=Alicyclobacillus tolerans TaxID=90970 RepID=A0ABT9LXV4_9BACL|nr:HAMP domain-containing sensor histidine kinase [Alicyclobacillus tengchongensis]MDP9729079.1 signal transduction histidine kinase [Alicyclobacillus tengchongensis]
MFQQVRMRIALLALSLVLIIYTISSIAVYAIVHLYVIHGIDQHLHTIAERVANEYDATGNVEITGNLLPHGTYLFFAASGTLFVKTTSSLQPVLVNLIHNAPPGEHYVDLTADGIHYRVFYVLSNLGKQGTDILMVAQDDRVELSVLNNLKTVIFLVGLAGMLISTLAGFFLANRVLRPIRAAWQRQLEFVADASHEMRTPLAVIQSNLNIAMGHTDESILDNLEWLNNAHSETRRLSKLVTDLLTLARSDSEKLPLQIQTLSIEEVFDKVTDLYSSIVEMNGIRYRSEIAASAAHQYFSGDADRIQQLLLILLDNARKFTPAGGEIALIAERSRNHLLIQIKDTGRGIAPEDLPRVFDRFFTGDASRTRETSNETGVSGTGLGLSIAKWIVEAHKGKISITSEGLGLGTTVTIELPIASPRSSSE